ncbi:MAG: NUDIX hydrolase [Holophagales bacterium]|jgi:8-oxo-dGTP pyrophosphatase MutT (NUDIX family)|nr:NUDIX hydrolase [Holophagales bacterium]
MRLIAQVCPQFDPSARWRDGGSRTVAKSPIFSLVEIQRQSPHSGKNGTYYRLSCPEWVHAIPFTAVDAGFELLAVEQHRHGIEKASLEVPGGACDPGEDPLDAAKRELLEETGFSSDNWTHLGFCTPNPAIQDNRCHFFLALGCAQTRELNLDPTEELRVWAMPWAEWKSKLETGEIHHGLILAAFERLRLSSAWASLQQQINNMSN